MYKKAGSFISGGLTGDKFGRLPLSLLKKDKKRQKARKKRLGRQRRHRKERT